MKLPKIKLFRTKLEPGEEQKPVIKYLNRFSLIGHVLLSFALILYIESVSRHSVPQAFSWMVHSPVVFLCNALLIFTSLLLVYFFRNRTLMRVAISIFWMAMGTVNGVILSNRVTPFTFADLNMISDLADMSSSKYVTLPMIVGVVVAVIVIIALLIFLFKKAPKYKARLSRPLNLLAFVVLVACMPFIMKSFIHAGVLAGYFGNVAQGYQEYGFTYSFCCGMVDNGMHQSDDYTEDTIDSIESSTKVGKTTLKKSDEPNVIFIQLESFIDPDTLKFLSYDTDPTPNFHKLMKNYASGAFNVPVVGAGTANTELEALTGMGVHFFGLGEYPYKTVIKKTVTESSANVFKSLGYSTHVIHNNSAGFYSRNLVFANMGFDTFTSKENMDIEDYNAYGTWPADDLLVSETKKTLDSTKSADFIYTITVQSHGNYPTEQVYLDPEVKVTSTGITKEQHYQWEYYINQIHEVDKYIGKLIKMLEKRDEKTLVVMYGDHLPTMGLTEDDLTTGSLFETTYATWNNFDFKCKDKDVSSSTVMAYFMDKLGIHEGTFFKLHQYAMKHDLLDNKRYQKAWELLQYDVLYGKKYCYGEKDKYQASDLEFGVEDVVLGTTDIKRKEGVLEIYGKNFTPWSKVYINDKKVSTEFVSTKCLKIALSDLEEGDTLVVNQMSTAGLILRSSNTITYVPPVNLTDVVEADIEDTKESARINESVIRFNKRQKKLAKKNGIKITAIASDEVVKADEEQKAKEAEEEKAAAEKESKK